MCAGCSRDRQNDLGAEVQPVRPVTTSSLQLEIDQIADTTAAQVRPQKLCVDPRVSLPLDTCHLGTFNTEASHEPLLIEDKGIGIVLEQRR